MTGTTAAPNTSRALDELARLRAAGWTPHRQFGDRRSNASQISDMLTHLEELGIDTPATLADQLSPLADAYERLDRIVGREPAGFTLDDLNAPDAAHRFDQAVVAHLTVGRAQTVADGVRDELNTRIVDAIRPRIQSLFDAVDAFYTAHAAEFHAYDAPGLTGAQRDERDHLRKHLTAAATWLWGIRSGGYDRSDYDAQPWVLWFEFTPEAWAKLPDHTGPGYRLTADDHYTVAVTKCGATPRMAASYQAAEQHALALTNQRSYR